MQLLSYEYEKFKTVFDNSISSLITLFMVSQNLCQGIVLYYLQEPRSLGF